MMGKTHIAGALAAWAVAYPMLVKTTLSTPQDAMILAASLGGTVLGGLLPDIDQPGSTIDQTLFGALGKTRIGAMVGGVLLLSMSIFLRIPSLIRLVCHSSSFLSVLLHYAPRISLFSGVIAVALVVIASMKHRGISHTLLGMGLFLWGADTLLGYIPILTPWRVALLYVYGAGYLSHLLLDLMAHGVPLFYPVIKRRIRLPFSIRTGSFGDVVVIRFGLLAYFIFALATSYLPAAVLTHLNS
ncbi:metal-dependent hydrolase [Desulfosporosinus sp. BG]|uniref:metal-dependent hydrolase n=1 Tax=Desulfosporosinus sp. BG TaxID=1633135 RepID=UPI00083B6278|nr:metal-dependent hydrolase [Desulfosporosinus sp. BG]ODA40055.1 hypothetical protein DSBG_3173 [Desulfosporosinus sp. BG]